MINRMLDSLNKGIIERVFEKIEVDEEELYWCGKCLWKGTFEQTILKEDRQLGCPNCGAYVFEV